MCRASDLWFYDISDPSMNPVSVRSKRNICESFRVKNMMLCWLAVGVPNPCMYVYTCVRMIMNACKRSCSPCQSLVDYENTNPACKGQMYFCTVNLNTRVESSDYTLSSTHWQQASKLTIYIYIYIYIYKYIIYIYVYNI